MWNEEIDLALPLSLQDDDRQLVAERRCESEEIADDAAGWFSSDDDEEEVKKLMEQIICTETANQTQTKRKKQPVEYCTQQEDLPGNEELEIETENVENGVNEEVELEEEMAKDERVTAFPPILPKPLKSILKKPFELLDRSKRQIMNWEALENMEFIPIEPIREPHLRYPTKRARTRKRLSGLWCGLNVWMQQKIAADKTVKRVDIGDFRCNMCAFQFKTKEKSISKNKCEHLICKRCGNSRLSSNNNCPLCQVKEWRRVYVETSPQIRRITSTHQKRVVFKSVTELGARFKCNICCQRFEGTENCHGPGICQQQEGFEDSGSSSEEEDSNSEDENDVEDVEEKNPTVEVDNPLEQDKNRAAPTSIADKNVPSKYPTKKGGVPRKQLSSFWCGLSQKMLLEMAQNPDKVRIAENGDFYCSCCGFQFKTEEKVVSNKCEHLKCKQCARIPISRGDCHLCKILEWNRAYDNSSPSTEPMGNVKFRDKTVPYFRDLRGYKCSFCGININDPNLGNLNVTCGHLFCGECNSSNEAEETNCLICSPASSETEQQEGRALEMLTGTDYNGTAPSENLNEQETAPNESDTSNNSRCPECLITYDSSRFRKVIDSCQHEKCRRCCAESLECVTCTGSSSTDERQYQVPSATTSSSSASSSRSNLVEHVQINSPSQTLLNNLNDGSYQGEDGSLDVEPRVESDIARLALQEYELQETNATQNDDDLIPIQNQDILNNHSVETDNSEAEGESVGKCAFEDSNSSDSDSNKDIVDRGSSSDNYVMNVQRQDFHEIETGPRLQLVSNGRENHEEEANNQQKPGVGNGNKREDVDLPQTVIPTCSPIIAPETVTEGLRSSIATAPSAKPSTSSKSLKVIPVPSRNTRSKDAKNVNNPSRKQPPRTKKKIAPESSDIAIEPVPKQCRKDGVPGRLHCLDCSKSFLNQRYLNCHIRLCHSDDRPFSCVICEKSFKRKANLKDHIQLHTGEKPWFCVPCGKDFALKKGLQDHFQTATHLRLVQKKMDSKRDFKCTTCGKGFLMKWNLKKHMKTHSDMKPYKCEECGQSFIYNCLLKRHKLVHTGDRPFQCQICSKMFQQSGHLNKHMKTH